MEMKQDVEMKVVRESEVESRIANYTKIHGKIPKYINGTYNQLVEFMYLPSFTRFIGEEVYCTTLGAIRFRLDCNAEDWYLSE